ncbi:hypothetical protein [Pseudanabaena sp. FACHB-2040]|uniref:hypothetical protein n=1 Tax=Pseudanabaena sp. FACHB-2040 TaxID=2692859 RepID=UPI0016897A0D|nr:hypothetical protein [Pseudanabaena sp. FACHB-2040]
MADLSGMWLGTYWQAENPTRFEATLVQGGNTLSGRVLDDNYLGEAQIQGEVVGRRVSFAKRYLTTSPTAIQYTGTVSEDGNHIQGEWTIGRFDTGPWEAHRSQDDLVVDLQATLEKQDLTPATATVSGSTGLGSSSSG